MESDPAMQSLEAFSDKYGFSIQAGQVDLLAHH